MSNCEKSLDLNVSRLDFTVKPIGSWSNDELRREVRRRFESKFLHHSFEEIHLESSSSNEAEGSADIEPGIDVPVDAKSDLHPGTLEWAIVLLREGEKMRRKWWACDCYVFLLRDPADLDNMELEYDDSLVKEVSTWPDQPVPIFVNQKNQAAILSGSEFINSIDKNNWEVFLGADE